MQNAIENVLCPKSYENIKHKRLSLSTIKAIEPLLPGLMQVLERPEK